MLIHDHNIHRRFSRRSAKGRGEGRVGYRVRTIAIPTCAAMLCLPNAAFATQHQSDPAPSEPISAETALERARTIYSIRPPRIDPCPPEREGVIVVCRRLEDPESQRVPGSIDQAIAAGRAVADGLPRAPDVFGLPSCEVVKCIGIGSVPPPALMIDLKALPEPPSGSAAAAYGYQPPAPDDAR